MILYVPSTILKTLKLCTVPTECVCVPSIILTNSVPGGITGLPYSRGKWYGNLALQVEAIWKSKNGTESREIRTEKDCTVEVQQPM
jgi:hypothetical protein